MIPVRRLHTTDQQLWFLDSLNPWRFGVTDFFLWEDGVSFFDVPSGPTLPTAGTPSVGSFVPLDGTDEMTGGLKLAQIAAASATNEVLFADTSNDNKPSWKDDSGTLFDLTDTGETELEGP